MSDNITVTAFPSNEAEALTMLYLQNQQLGELTPEQLAGRYKEVYSTIKNCLKQTIKLSKKAL